MHVSAQSHPLDAMHLWGEEVVEVIVRLRCRLRRLRAVSAEAFAGDSQARGGVCTVMAADGMSGNMLGTCIA